MFGDCSIALRVPHFRYKMDQKQATREHSRVRYGAEEYGDKFIDISHIPQVDTLAVFTGMYVRPNSL